MELLTKFLKNAYPSTQVLSPSIQYTWTCSPKHCSPYNYFTELLFYCSGHVVARVQLDQITNHRSLPALLFSHLWHNEEWLSQLWSWQISSGASSRLVWSADEGAVSVDIAAKVAKECRVHFIRSMKRVSKKVQSSSTQSIHQNSLPDSWCFHQGPIQMQTVISSITSTDQFSCL